LSDDHQKQDVELALLLDYLQRTRGLDLSGYKRVGLLRRLTKRMRGVGVEGFSAPWRTGSSSPLAGGGRGRARTTRAGRPLHRARAGPAAARRRHSHTP